MVVDVPAKLSARARVFSTGQGRKTDATDAPSVAVVALRAPRLQVVRVDDALVALRLLVDRRDQLGRARSQTVNRRHRLLPELVPGAKRFLSATQARALVSPARPRDVAGRTRRRLASELISDLAAIDRKIRAANVQPRQLIAATGSGQLELNGLGPSGAARPLGDVGDICRFADRARFASWNGTAPIDASSGDQRRHRLSRAGNRRINRVPPIMAIVQLRNDTEGRAHDRRTLAAGKTTREALRCLKRRLSDVVSRQMIADAKTAAGPGGQAGTTLQSSVTDPTPAAGSSEKSRPGPATNNFTPAAATKPVRSSARSRRRSSAPNRSPRQAHCLTRARTGAHPRGGNGPP
jgi:transposase